MTWIAYVAIAGAGLFVWLWKRERKARQRAEAAAETHKLRADVEARRSAALEASHDQLNRELAEVERKHKAEAERLQTVGDRIDAAIAADGDEALAAEWNALRGKP